MSARDFLLRAALLGGLGREAPALADRLDRLVEAGAGRSCLDAGAPVQLTVDAPGPPRLRVGVRVGDHLPARALSGLVPDAAAGHLAAAVARTPEAGHPSLGTWLFWSPGRASVFLDLRDPSPADALVRAEAAVGERYAARVAARRPPTHHARPWTLRMDADEDGLVRIHVLWLLDRHAPLADVADAMAPGRWPVVREVLGRLLRLPDRSGRFVIATPLDDASEPGLRVGSTGWALVPEDDAKRRALSDLVTGLGGPRDHAEALWSLCRSGAPPRWRVGRACEVLVTERGARARLFLVPPTSAA